MSTHAIRMLLISTATTALRVPVIRMGEGARKREAGGNMYNIRGDGRFFLDTADMAEMEALLPLGIFHGVTTNPTLLQQAGIECTLDNCAAVARRAFELGAGEVMLQTWGTTTSEMTEKGFWLSSVEPATVVVKVPVTPEGTLAAAELNRNGVRVCLTACYAHEQALIASGIGAEYIAPYLGRMTDAGKNGHEECLQMQKIVDGLGGNTRILVASIRDVSSLTSLAASSMDTFTFSPAIARQLFAEPLTIQAAAAFEAAAQGA